MGISAPVTDGFHHIFDSASPKNEGYVQLRRNNHNIQNKAQQVGSTYVGTKEQAPLENIFRSLFIGKVGAQKAGQRVGSREETT